MRSLTLRSLTLSTLTLRSLSLRSLTLRTLSLRTLTLSTSRVRRRGPDLGLRLDGGLGRSLGPLGLGTLHTRLGYNRRARFAPGLDRLRWALWLASFDGRRLAALNSRWRHDGLGGTYCDRSRRRWCRCWCYHGGFLGNAAANDRGWLRSGRRYMAVRLGLRCPRANGLALGAALVTGGLAGLVTRRPSPEHRAARLEPLRLLRLRHGLLLLFERATNASNVVRIERRHMIVHLETERSDLRDEVLVRDPHLFGNLIDAHLRSGRPSP